MHYLVHPYAPLKWNDLPRSLFNAAVEHGADLAQLEWKAGDEPHDVALVVELALRHGRPCSAGIVLPAEYVSTAERPGLIRRSYEDLQHATQHPSIRATDELIEGLAPGWIEAGQKLDVETGKATANSIAEAEQAAAHDMRAPRVPALVKHWVMLGGVA